MISAFCLSICSDMVLRVLRWGGGSGARLPRPLGPGTAGVPGGQRLLRTPTRASRGPDQGSRGTFMPLNPPSLPILGRDQPGGQRLEQRRELVELRRVEPFVGCGGEVVGALLDALVDRPPLLAEPPVLADEPAGAHALDQGV